MVYFFLFLIFALIIFLIVFVNRKILQLRKKKAKEVTAEIIDEATRSKFAQFFVNASEKYVSSLGNGYILNFLANRSVKRGFAIISDKRVYFRGSCFTGTGKNLVKSDEQRTVDIKDVTGSGFIYRRYLGVLLALVTAFVTLIGGIAGAGYGVAGVVDTLSTHNHELNSYKGQIKAEKTFNKKTAEADIEKYREEIGELQSQQASIAQEYMGESESFEVGLYANMTDEEIELAIERAFAKACWKAYEAGAYKTPDYLIDDIFLIDHLVSIGIDESNYRNLLSISDKSRYKEIKASYTETEILPVVDRIIDRYRDDKYGFYIRRVFDMFYGSLMSYDENWYDEIVRAYMSRYFEFFVYEDIYRDCQARGIDYSVGLFLEINRYPEDYDKAIKTIEDDGVLFGGLGGRSSDYIKNVINELGISYDGDLLKLRYYELIKLCRKKCDSSTEAAPSFDQSPSYEKMLKDPSYKKIASEIDEYEKKITKLEEDINEYQQAVGSLESQKGFVQEDISVDFLKIAGLGGLMGLLLTFAISVMLVFLDYLKKRKTFFEIQYAGGRIAFDVSFYALAEIEDFQRMLRRTKDLAEVGSSMAEGTMYEAKQAMATEQATSVSVPDKAEELRKYAKLLEEGLISQDDYNAMKKKVLEL